jgi:hypothetical protein
MLRELLAALDVLPEKRLAANSLVTEDGEYCALGALGRARGMDLEPIDPDDRPAVAESFGIAEALVAEIMWLNDEHVDEWEFVDVEICGPMRTHYPDWGRHTKSVRVRSEGAAERRWRHMRHWVASQIKEINQ